MMNKFLKIGSVLLIFPFASIWSGMALSSASEQHKLSSKMFVVKDIDVSRFT